MPEAEDSLLDPAKVDGIVIIIHLACRVFLTLAFTLAFFIVLGFILWNPNKYLVIVEVVLAPTTFLMAQFFFPIQPIRKRGKAQPKKP